MTPTLHRNRIVSVVYYGIRYRYICGRDIKTVCIEREAAGGTICVNDRVGNGNVITADLDIPGDRFPGLEVLHAAVGCVEVHEMRATSKASAVQGVCVPLYHISIPSGFIFDLY